MPNKTVGSQLLKPVPWGMFGILRRFWILAKTHTGPGFMKRTEKILTWLQNWEHHMFVVYRQNMKHFHIKSQQRVNTFSVTRFQDPDGTVLRLICPCKPSMNFTAPLFRLQLMQA